MAKIIKRAGIIFFVSVISCLLLIGIVVFANANKNVLESAPTSNIDNVSIDSKNNITKSTVGKIDKEVIFKGTTCEEIAEEWNDVIVESLEGLHIKVVLSRDWIAPTSGNNYFGSYENSFFNGSIAVPEGATITLDLNGFKIDRKLTVAVNWGNVMYVRGNLILMDSKYDEQKVLDAYNKNPESNLQSYGAGGITGGYITNDGGALVVSYEGYFEMNGGMIYGNIAQGSQGGGAIYSGINSSITINSGMIINNQAIGVHNGIISGDGGAINFQAKKLQINGGIIHNNSAIDTGGAISAYNDKSTVNITGGLISRNAAHGWGCAMRVVCKEFNMDDGIIERNYFMNDLADKSGAGVVYTQVGTFNFNGGEIRNNSFDTYGAITIVSSDVIIRNCKIYNNISAKDGAGINTHHAVTSAYGTIAIGAGAQIYNNTNSSGAADVFLTKGERIRVVGKLATSSSTTHVGVLLGGNYTGEFTYGYYTGGNYDITPSRYFFSNSNKRIDTSGREAILKDEDNTATDLTWKWTGGQTNGGSNATVNYTGRDYVISATGEIYMQGEDAPFTSRTLRDAGSYAFYSAGNYKNPTFMFTILPKEVNVVWNNDNLVYNGKVQSPAASIAEDSECTVTIQGGNINAGSGYKAVAIALSNKNYKIKASSNTKYYNITKAKLTAPSGSANYILDGEEHVFTPDNFDDDKMEIEGNKAKTAGVHTAKITIKDTSNYEWSTGGTEEISLTYTIEDKSMIKNGIYDFLYLEQDGDKLVRKSYRENGIYRLVNDSEVVATNNNGKLILGNITPNTSVNEFVNNLMFDITKLQIYNSKGMLIYDKGNANVNEDLLNNGKELAIGTGWYMEYQSGSKVERITLSVLGDVNGDGRISASDVSYLRQLASDDILYQSLSTEKKLASMVVNKGNVTSADAEIVRNVIDKLLMINLFF